MLEFGECIYCSGKSRPSDTFCRKALGDFKRGRIFTLCMLAVGVCSHLHSDFMEVCPHLLFRIMNYLQ